MPLRSSTPSRPHEAHKELDKVDRDDEESAVWAELDDRFGFDGLKRDTADDELDLSRCLGETAAEAGSCEPAAR